MSCPHWNKDGWYFWDETQAHTVGPFSSEDLAKEGKYIYCKMLNAETDAEMRDLSEDLKMLLVT